MHSLAEELNNLDQEIPGTHLAGSSHPCTLRSHGIQVTADMPAIDTLINSTGSNGYAPNRARAFHGASHATSNHYYIPPEDPIPGEVMNSAEGCTEPRRSATRFLEGADEVEDAR